MQKYASAAISTSSVVNDRWARIEPDRFVDTSRPSRIDLGKSAWRRLLAKAAETDPAKEDDGPVSPVYY